MYYICLTSSSVANDKDGVSDVNQLFQLNYLQYKVVLSLQTQVLTEQNIDEITSIHNKTTYMYTNNLAEFCPALDEHN